MPIVKSGKDDNRDASKNRSISRLNVLGKLLDKLMIDRIMHHVHSSAGLNSNQYGFIPQRGTVDAAMAVKEIIEENLKKKLLYFSRWYGEGHLPRHGGQAFCVI